MKAPATPKKMTSALSQRRHYTQLDLFDEARSDGCAPLMPTPGTCMDQVLKRLLAGPFTQADFDQSWRLATYVYDLRGDGWAIVTTMVLPLGANGLIAEYALDLRDPATRAAVVTYRALRGAQ